MALPPFDPNNPTPISIGNLQTEFGGTGVRALSTYYRGGSLVPNHSSNGTIPTSGTIALSNFYGTAKNFVSTITVGFFSAFGFSQSGYRDSNATYGSVTFSGVQKYGTSTIIKFNEFWNDNNTGSWTFGVEGNHTGTWWNSIVYRGVVGNRSGTGDFGTGSTTRWSVTFPAGTPAPDPGSVDSFELRP